MWCPI